MSGDPDPDPDAAATAIEHCYEQGWSDGLPLVPVSDLLLGRFPAATGRPPGDVIGRLPQLDREVTVELAAINAAMAGCRPEYFPVVLAAWSALMAERAASGGGWRNVFGIHPHELEQATQGLPGRWSICVAENEEETPWESLSAEAGLPPGTSAVSATLLRTSEFVDNRHTADAEQLLADFADTLSRTGAWIFRNASAGIVFCPEHAQLLAGAGYGRAEVRAWLAEHSGRSVAELARAGKDGLSGNGVRHADGDRPDGFDPLLPGGGREHLLLAVAGARNAGISMVVRQFSLWSGTAVPVEPAAVPA